MCSIFELGDGHGRAPDNDQVALRSLPGSGDPDIGVAGVAGFARATLPQEGIAHESPKSTRPDPKAKLQPDSEDEDSPM